MRRSWDKEELAAILRSMINAEGSLSDHPLLVSREVIYQGRNGKAVERIVVSAIGSVVPLIFKPLTNAESIGKELWAIRHLLPSLPMVRYPELIAVSDTETPEHYWMVYEDLGELRHAFDQKTLIAAAQLMPYWHTLPLEQVPADFIGHSPKLEIIFDILHRERESLRSVLEALGLQQQYTTYITGECLQMNPADIHGETVVCHGDFNPLNIALRSDETVILDWEYAHRNSVYWDLYNLLDITSPHYRRPVLDRASRLAVLQAYAAKRGRLGTPPADAFIQGYHRYCLAYSAWVLLLIADDLGQGRFERNGLLRQSAESYGVLMEMAAFLTK